MIYLQLFAAALVPVFLSVIFYLLQKKTPFGRLSYVWQQIIIGILFGGAAVLGTEYGVDIGGATANARDAAPLCAGLLFGAPAGIIAGIIGGVERWFAVLWGAGEYSRVACSLSTVLAGVYAAALRKFMFDDKRPTWGFGFATGVVMEVIHLSILFLTHLKDAENAYRIVAITTGPMVLCNAVSVMLSILAILLFVKQEHHGEKHIRSISQKVQSAMLICVAAAYVFTTLFVYILQTNSALTSAVSVMSITLNDTVNEITEDSDDAFWQNLTENRHIGKSGYMLIADSHHNIVGGSKPHTTLKNYDITVGGNTAELTLYRKNILGEKAFYMYCSAAEHYIIAVFPESEVYQTRDASTYINSFMEVLVFALLFVLIYSLIKKLVVNNIRNVNKNLEEIIGGNLNVTVDVHSSKEFSSLSDDINSTVTTLKHYISEAAARIDKELEFARSIQTSALPSVEAELSDVKELSMDAVMYTAKAVGGDFYDIYKLENDKVAFLIADVSGKGIPAAMFMMRAKTMLRNFAEEGLPVNEIFTRANEKLCEGNDAGMFVTAWMGIIDRKTGHVTFANAGHNPPLLCRAGEKFTYLTGRPGFVLAGMEGIVYKMQELDLRPGDKFYLYTDGVTEATDAANKLYGEPRLNDTLNAHAEIDTSEILAVIKKDIDAFVGDAEQFDDITMVALHYTGTEEINMAERVFPAADSALADAQGFVEEELEKANCGMKTAMQISVALEELFINVAHYAYGDKTGDVKIGIGIADGVATLTLADSGTPFDPLAKTDPDITLSADERQIGGLGIFMVKKTMDSVTYAYKNGQNVLTVKKKIS